MTKITSRQAPCQEKISAGKIWPVMTALANRIAALELEAQERAEMVRIAEEKKQAKYQQDQAWAALGAHLRSAKITDVTTEIINKQQAVMQAEFDKTANKCRDNMNQYLAGLAAHQIK